MKKIEKPLPGKIAIETMDHVCKIYEGSDTADLTFKIRNDSDVQYGGFTWLNKQDSFVGSEYVPGKERNDYKGNIVVFDLHGKVVERLYEAKAGEIAGLTYPSRNDNYLLFTIEKMGDFNTNPLEGLMRMNSIIVMDLQKKEIIKVVKDVGIIPSFEIHESPWLFDETRFVYSYTRPKGRENDNKYDSSGVYICDIGKAQRKLLIRDANYAICSPTCLKIAYIKDQALRVMDLETGKETMIYKAAANEKFRNIHWTPDGKCIYFAYLRYYIFDFFVSGEKLLDIDTRETIPFKTIELGFETYSWK